MTTARKKRFHLRYGPWAVVTGSSSGIGREIATRLAEDGFHLVLAARSGPALEMLAAEFRSAHAIDVRVLAVDLATETGIEEVVSQTAGLEIGLSVLAAGFGTSGHFVQSNLADELSMLDVNCRAVLTLSSHFARRFAAQGRGGIILFSSLVAFQGVPNSANYAATKAYVQSLAEALHIELKPSGVDVLASAPGPIYSGFATRASMQFKMGQHPESVAQATLKALGRRMTVRPGWLSKFLEGSLKMLPRWGRVRMMGVIMGGMTKP